MAHAERLAPSQDETYRSAPHNVEAEQALLGRHPRQQRGLLPRLRFPRAEHFYEPMHREIYEVGGELIRASKIADAGHGQDLPARPTSRSATSRIAAVSRAPRRRGDDDHQRRGLRPHDLRPRDPPQPDPHRRGHGQRRLRRAGRDDAARADRGRREAALRARREGPLRRRLPALSTTRCSTPSTWRAPPTSATATSRASPPASTDLDRHDGRPADVRPHHPRRPPRHGQDARSPPTSPSTSRKAWHGEVQPDGTIKTVDGGIVGFFSLEMSSEQLATRILAEQAGISSSDIRRGRIHEDQFARIVEAAQRDAADPALHRPDRRPLDRPARRPRPPPEAPARPRPPRHRLPAAAPGLVAQRGNENRVQEITEITNNLKALAKELERADHGAVAALAPGREPRRQAPAALRPARIGLDRAGRRRGALRLSARSTTSRTRSRRKARRSISTWQEEMEQGPRPRRGDHRQAAPRPDRHGAACSSRRSSRASPTSRARTTCRRPTAPDGG